MAHPLKAYECCQKNRTHDILGLQASKGWCRTASGHRPQLRSIAVAERLSDWGWRLARHERSIALFLRGRVRRLQLSSTALQALLAKPGLSCAASCLLRVTVPSLVWQDSCASYLVYSEPQAAFAYLICNSIVERVQLNLTSSSLGPTISP